jgi:capsular exopolysaccharide synthesis family protein
MTSRKESAERDRPEGRARVAFGARVIRPRRRAEGGPPPVAQLLADALQEQCETLRSSLEVSLARVTHRVVMATAAVHEEGCTTILSALAFNLTVRGSARVLVVDANLRRPAISRIFGVSEDVGLHQILAGRVEAGMTISGTAFPGLSVLPLGPGQILPAQVFGSNGLGGLLGTIKEHYDYVLVDAPPLLSVPEVAVLGAEVDGVMLVARAGRTKRQALVKARHLLERSGANLLGLVLNRRRYAIPAAVYKRV